MLQNQTGNTVFGTLTVDYQIVVRFNDVTTGNVMCEFGGAPCFRLVPKVTYTWNSNSEPKANPRVVTAFYRLESRQRRIYGSRFRSIWTYSYKRWVCAIPNKRKNISCC